MNLKEKKKSSSVEFLFVYATLIYFELERDGLKSKNCIFSSSRVKHIRKILFSSWNRILFPEKNMYYKLIHNSLQQMEIFIGERFIITCLIGKRWISESQNK